MFYLAGIANAFFGVYVLFEGTALMPRETATWLVVICLAFAALNFYMAHALKKKWEEDMARLKAQRAAGSAGDTGK
jgi:hypothetical protein